MIKTLSKVGIEGAYLNIIKTIYKKPTANIILNGQKLKAFPCLNRNKIRVSAFTTFIQHSIRNYSQNDLTRILKRGIQIGKGEVKLSSFTDNIIAYVENPLVSTKKLLDLPWLVWLSGLSADLRTKGSLVRFPVRAHAWVSGQVPSWGCIRG